MQNNQGIAIIIIFYQPSEGQFKQAYRLAASYPIIIVDNTPGQRIESHGFYKYIPLYANKGIAEAQNIAVDAVKNDGMEYLLFLDQDSKVKASDIEAWLSEYESIAQEDSCVGAIGPVLINNTDGSVYKNALKSNQVERCRVDTLVSSGMLIKTTVWETVGPMDSTLFIDYVDFDWCWRATSKGYHLYLTSGIQLKHQVGADSFTFCTWAFVKSAPGRYYYRMRNYLWLLRRRYVPIRWKVRTLCHTIIEIFLVFFHPLYQGERKSVLKNLAKGFFDGLKTQKNLRLS